MKTIIFILITLFFRIEDVSAETYQQCKARVLADISKHEQQTGKTVTQENKRLAVQAYCSGR